MTAVNTSSGEPASSTRVRAPSKHTSAKTKTMWNCLLVSRDDALHGRFEQEAREAGWEMLACRSPPEAVRLAILHRVRMAFVDLDEQWTTEINSYRQLLERLRAADGHVVIVCDRQADPETELLARQFGVWIYMPGISAKTDLTSICREARTALEKTPVRAPKFSSLS